MSDTAGATADADTGQQSAADAAAAAATAGDAGDGKDQRNAADTQQSVDGKDKGQQDNGAGTDAGRSAADTDSQQAPDWRDMIEDKQHREFADRVTSVADLAASAFDMRQKLSSAIVLPGKDASEEDIAAFHKKLGVPEKPEDYGYTRPEDLSVELTDREKERETEFLALAHKQGLTPASVAATLNFLYADMDAEHKALVKTLEEGREKSVNELKKEWGDDHKANATYAHRAAQAHGGDDFVKFLSEIEVDGLQLSNHPAFLRVFSQIGRQMGEHGIPMPLGDEERMTAAEEAKDIREKKAEAQAKGDTAEAERLDQAERDIYARTEGTGPIVGQGGRTV